MRAPGTALFAVLAAVLVPGVVPAEEDRSPPAEQPMTPNRPNRLARESSPYLLQHAHNPVDWYPWCPEAFERAKKERKLIFLSIGYSSCHWCHVMERESFANPEVARLLNQHFVCIKVDREERPDIDDVYMTALTVTGESGGWPLTMFLTPEGKPIFGGTYFPPEDRRVGEVTLPGLKTILAKVAEWQAKESEGLARQAEAVARATAEVLERNSRLIALVPLDRALIEAAAGAFEIDPEYGGTGNRNRRFQGNKFPRPPVWQFLLARSARSGQASLAGLVHLTLRKMAEGGIYDHLGGGFHRYSTDRTWTVPHFEKLLTDNAQLVELYAAAYAVRPEPLYRRVVEETLAFVKRELTNPDGAFYSALDAETDGVEGAYYVWTADELRQVLDTEAEFALARAVYGLTEPNFEGKAFVLRYPKPLAEIAADQKLTEAALLARLAPVRLKLLQAREKRKRPFRDTKLIAGWNGLMIAGYARAGCVFANADYVRTAAAAAEFVLTRLRGRDGRLFRIYAAVPGEPPAARGPAFLDDYAYLVHGLLSLHEATGEARWLAAARELTETALRWYADADRGGYFFTPSDGEQLFVRVKDHYDGVQPSGNSQMTRNLIRLAVATGEARYRELAHKTLKAFALTLQSQPTTVPILALALDEYLGAFGEKMAGAGKVEPPRSPRESADVVTARLMVAPPTDGRHTLTITLRVADGWHIYAHPVGAEDLLESQTQLRVFVDGQEVAARVDYPAGRDHADADGSRYRVYTGEVMIRATVPAPPRAALEACVRVVACRQGRCLLPSVLRLRSAP